MGTMRRIHIAAFLIAGLLISAPHTARTADTGLTATEEAEIDSLVLTPPAPWSGDFKGMRERGLVRILVPYNKTHYFVDGGRQYGIAYELGIGFEAALNKKYPKQKLPFRVMFLPTARDQIFDQLVEGKGDIAIAGLTVTPERQKVVDFSIPFASGINEIVVASSRAPQVASLEDLSGREITMRASSSYYAHLLALIGRFRAAGRPEMNLTPADDDLEDEDLLEMANAGLIDFVVVDHYLADLWGQVFNDITPRSDLVINQGGDIAFAVRKNAGSLKSEVDAYVKANKAGTAVGNILIKRYITNTNFIKNVASEEDMSRYAEIVDFFERYSATYNFDPLMITAQGYQESGLRQSLRSARGAVGIMQLLPTTAADPAVGIEGIETDAERNIQAVPNICGG